MAAVGPEGITVSPHAVEPDAWVVLRDPSGPGSSRVPAGRVAYYLAKGFREIGDPAQADSHDAADSLTCPRCGFVAKDARGLAVHQVRRHRQERDQ